MQYKLNEKELSEIKGRDKARAWLSALIDLDIQMYIKDEVLPRLGLPVTTPVQVDVENGTVQVINSQKKNK